MHPPARAPLHSQTLWHRITRNTELYIIFFFPLLYIVVFKYIPLYGAQLAFKDFNAVRGITGSSWVGLAYFERFFTSYQFPRVLKNTVTLSFYGLLAGFPFPILLAIALNEARSVHFRKTVQMITYMPYFISTVILVSLLKQMLHLRVGVVNSIVQQFGGVARDFMASPHLFKSLYVWSGVWQGTGYSAIIYLAALSGVDPQLYDAAVIDGASRIRRIFNVDLPTILPTITIVFILATGNIMNVGFEKVYLMQNPLNMSSSEIISTYVYKIGLIQGNYSFSTAVSLFNSTVNFCLLVFVNWIARRAGGSSLW